MYLKYWSNLLTQLCFCCENSVLLSYPFEGEIICLLSVLYKWYMMDSILWTMKTNFVSPSMDLKNYFDNRRSETSILVKCLQFALVFGRTLLLWRCYFQCAVQDIGLGGHYFYNYISHYMKFSETGEVTCSDMIKLQRWKFVVNLLKFCW